jgi:hypothetical protein
MNLHAIANKAIQIVHPNERAYWHKSLGQTNQSGLVKPTYSAGLEVELQAQSETPDELAHSQQNVGTTEISRKVWMFVTSAGMPEGINRAKCKGGDLIKRADGSWWLVTAVSEDFSQSGWVSLRITYQVIDPVIINA